MNDRMPRDLDDELQGYVELGMQKESLRLARQLLKQRTVTSQTFIGVLQAVLVHADHLRRWRPLIEAVHAKFTQKQKRLVRTSMFHFYVSMDEFGVAFLYMPLKPRTAEDLLFSMWTLLELRYFDACDEIAERIKKIWKNPQSELEISCVLEAIASYCAQQGWLEEAENLWQQAVGYTWFDGTAWMGLINLQVVKAHRYVDKARKHMAERTPDYNPALPQNEKELKKEFLKKFDRVKQSLNHVLPEKDLWRFGMKRTESNGKSL